MWCTYSLCISYMLRFRAQTYTPKQYAFYPLCLPHEHHNETKHIRLDILDGVSCVRHGWSPTRRPRGKRLFKRGNFWEYLSISVIVILRQVVKQSDKAEVSTEMFQEKLGFWPNQLETPPLFQIINNQCLLCTFSYSKHFVFGFGGRVSHNACPPLKGDSNRNSCNVFIWICPP